LSGPGFKSLQLHKRIKFSIWHLRVPFLFLEEPWESSLFYDSSKIKIFVRRMDDLILTFEAIGISKLIPAAPQENQVLHLAS